MFFKVLCWIWGIGLILSAAALVVAPPPPQVDASAEQKQLPEKIEYQLRDFDGDAAARNLRAATNASTGQCQNSNNLDARGHRCGGRAASERKGGK
jgi:hypothetical protein